MKKNLGNWGETEACRYLQRCGYHILERNFRCRLGEVDIIAKKGSVLCFVEVKTRKCLAYGLPSESVTEWKKKRIQKTMQYYLLLHQTEDKDFRMDVIEIILQGRKGYIRHIENAFS